MIIAAAALTLAVALPEINLGGLTSRRTPNETAPKVTCGIKVVGYHFQGTPGQQFDYAGKTYTIPRAGYVELISLPRVASYRFDGEKRPLEDEASPLDGFSFRWIQLPGAPAKGEQESR